MRIVFRPTSRLICKLYEDREPAKICHMRTDSMSQLINSTNVRSGSKVAVFETCSGVIMGMVLERLGGHGKFFYSAFFKDRKSMRKVG